MATVASDKAKQGVDSAAMEKQDEEMDSKTWVLFFLMYLLFFSFTISGQWVFWFLDDITFCWMYELLIRLFSFWIDFDNCWSDYSFLNV